MTQKSAGLDRGEVLQQRYWPKRKIVFVICAEALRMSLEILNEFQ